MEAKGLVVPQNFTSVQIDCWRLISKSLLFQLPCAVREEPNFGYSSSIMDQFFNSKVNIIFPLLQYTSLSASRRSQSHKK